LALEPFLRELHRLGWRHLVATDVTKDGMQSGINTSFYQQVFEAFSAPVVASGGVATLADVAALAELAGRTGALEGVIIGRALYEGAFTLSEALAQVAHVTATARKDAEAGDGIVSPTAGPAAGSPTAGDQQLRGVSRHEAREEGGDAV
jgi:phosphoribosylformimino-5-aminoimidazole carboxamide ribotide isomerase